MVSRMMIMVAKQSQMVKTQIISQTMIMVKKKSQMVKTQMMSQTVAVSAKRAAHAQIHWLKAKKKAELGAEDGDLLTDSIMINWILLLFVTKKYPVEKFSGSTRRA